MLTVLQSSESVTKVLAYTGAGCVLTLETLSATTHATIRGLSLEFEAPTTSDALRWGLILADRAELFALRRAGTLQKDRLAFSTTYCSEPVTGRSSDVEHLREGVVRFASPRLPVAITTEDALVDIALSEENLDAHARLHRGLLCQGVVRLDLTAQKGDLLGLRNQARYEGDSRCGGNWQSPRAGVIDDEVAAELMQAMAPTGGPDSLPRCLREAATRDYARLANQPMPDIDRLFDQVAAASAHLDAATLGRISAAFCWRFILAPRRPPSPHQAMPTRTRSTRCAKRPASPRASRAHYGATRCGEPCSRSCLHMSSRTTSTTFRSIVLCAHVTRHCSRCTFTSATAAARTP